MNNDIGRGILGRQSFAEPEQRRNDARILFAQALCQLRGESG
jgi:hypothetical protein